MSRRPHLGLGARARRTHDLVELADAAASGGFEHFWVYDSGRCVEAMVSLTYAGLRHPRLTVGTAVTNTQTREPAVLANGLATLANLTEGRVICGIGLGDSAVSFLGRRPAPIAEFAEKLGVIRALLHGDSVRYNGRSYRLPDPPERPPLILVSAEGPRTCALAARQADGAILSLSASPAVLGYLVGELREQARASGRDPNGLYICAWLQAAMAPDRRAAMAVLRPQAGRTLLAAVRHVPGSILESALPDLEADKRRLVESLAEHQDRELDLAVELAQLVGEDSLAEFTVVGTAEDCRRRISQLLDVPGISELAVNVYGHDCRAAAGDFMTQVLRPAVQRHEAAITGAQRR